MIEIFLILLCGQIRGEKPIFLSVENGDFKAVVAYVEAGGNVDVEQWGMPLLCKAISKEEHQIANFLLEQGAKVRVENMLGMTPLHFAVNYGTPEMMRTIIAKGARLNAKDVRRRSPLMFAAKSGDLERFKMLTTSGAKYKGKDKSRRTLLHYAAMGGNLEIVEDVIAKGFEWQQQDRDGYDAMMAAFEAGQLEVGRYFISKGASIHQTSRRGETLLHAVARAGEPRSLEYLIEKGQDVNAQCNSGITPLMAAVLANKTETVRTLLNLGADPSLETETGVSPLAYVRWMRSRELYNLLCETGWAGAELHCSAKSGDLEGVLSRLEKGDAVDVRNPAGETPLFVAIAADQPEIVKALIQQGADINAYTNYSWTPLYLATYRGNSVVVNILLEAGARVNRPVAGGDTPLGISLTREYETIAKRLRAAGANIVYFIPDTRKYRQVPEQMSLADVTAEHMEGLATDTFQKAKAPFWLVEHEVLSSDGLAKLGDPNVEPPVFTHKVAPSYPKNAFPTKEQGYVILEAVLGKDGEMRDIKVLRDLHGWRYGFEAEAIRALRQWRYRPGRVNGRDADIQMNIKIDFVIQGASFAPVNF